jgi:hypothetical protein
MTHGNVLMRSLRRLCREDGPDEGNACPSSRALRGRGTLVRHLKLEAAGKYASPDEEGRQIQ